MKEVLADRRIALYEAEKKKTQADREIINSLMKGNRELTAPLARTIYYKFILHHIQFESMLGTDFLDELTSVLGEEQMQAVREQIVREAQRRRDRKRLLRFCKRMTVSSFALVLSMCSIYVNWDFISGIKTQYDARQMQKKMEEDTRTEQITQCFAERQEQGNVLKSLEVEEKAATPETEKKQEQVQIQTREPLDKFKTLYDENNDFVGWLKIDDTQIDYPVMSREEDNNYYLDKDFEQNQDRNGMLILDYRCDVNGQGQNLIIYGHNMKTGAMFGNLKKYKQKSYGEEHQTIHFDSLYEENKYKVVAALLSEVAYTDEDVFRYYDAVDISTEQNFDAFREYIEQNAIYMLDEIKFGDSCMILSTCDHYTEDGRFVVIAKKK